MIWTFSKRSGGGAARRPLPRPGGAIALLLCGVGVSAACAPLSAVETPEWEVPSASQSVVYAAANSVRALAVTSDGAVWAATAGGVVRWGNESPSPRTWTTAEGMSSNDVRALTVSAKGTVLASSSLGVSEIDAQSGTVSGAGGTGLETLLAVRVTARAAKGTMTATPDGLFFADGKGMRQPVSMPVDSRASHVSALTVRDKRKGIYIAGLYGDGVYQVQWQGDKPPRWKRLPLPDTCRFVTALAAYPGDGLLIGTRDNGAFSRSANGSLLRPLETPGALPSGDIYGIAAFGGHLYASTFDRGIVSFTPKGSFAVYPEVRQGRTLVPFGDHLYALQADHGVVCFDGSNWKPAWAANTLRRADVYSIALDRTGHRLLVGGWGGWAEWDGTTWQQHWTTAGLSGESVTAIAADSTGAVWVGTQRRGLFRCVGDTTTAFQEAQGLTDDWITAIALSPKGRLLVGTYTGGILEREKERFVPRFAVDKWAMRRIVFDGEKALVATPVGLYREGTGNQWQQFDPRTTGGPEIQALLPAKNGVWVGTRNGLAFTPQPAQE